MAIQCPAARSACRLPALLVSLLCVAGAAAVPAQSLTGTLLGTVTDAQGAVVRDARVRLESHALIGGPLTRVTDAEGRLRFPALPPGRYLMHVERPGFTPYLAEGLTIGAGETIEHMVRLEVAGVSLSTIVDATASRIEMRDPGFSTRFGLEDLETIPTRRASMFDFIRAAPGISPTSPASGTTTTVSAFGSGTNENTFLIDGTNFTCPCNGVARSEPGVDFIQEVHLQTAGASAEFGSVQGAVINVVMKQGGDRWRGNAAYYGQMAGLTSSPVRLPVAGAPGQESGYNRSRYRDVSASGGGPAIRDRLWMFGGYEYLRDYDSQPGVAPERPRQYEQDKVFGKLTWRLAPGWQLVQSAHGEFWENPEPPTIAVPFEATLHRQASVPAATLAHLTRTTAGGTVWDARLGHFRFAQETAPIHGDLAIASRLDLPANFTSGAPREIGDLTIARTTAKVMVSRFIPRFIGVEHDWRTGIQVERGSHEATVIIPTGTRFVYSSGEPLQSISADPSNTGGTAITVSAFASNAVTIGRRLTLSAGLRFDHSRAISPDLASVDLQGQETAQQVQGLGLLYRWNVFSPRLGAVLKLTDDGRTVLRGSYGRFHAGVLTGELSPFHPGATEVTTRDFVAADGDYTFLRSRIHPGTNLRLDPRIRSPHTDELSVGLDRQVGRQLSLAVAYIRKDGRDFIGWTDAGGQYEAQTRVLVDGRVLPVLALTGSPDDRRFFLTNPADYAMTYDGLVVAMEKRRTQGWQAFGSYTYSRAFGLQAASGASAAGAQVSTVAPPPSTGLTFGQNPNDLTNARGRLPNDRPHVARVMASLDVPRTGLAVAANLQHFSGKPWAASTQVRLEGANRRILLEPRGSRRLSSQSLLDVRLSRTFGFGAGARVDVMLDVLNLLNDSAEESLVSDVLLTQTGINDTFGMPNVFMDPRRAMLSARVSLGR